MTTLHKYEMRKGDGGLGEVRLWCTLAACPGFRELVMNPDGDSFTASDMFEKMTEHAARFSGPSEALAGMSLAGRIDPPADMSWAGRTDVRATWEIKMPEQRQPREYAGLLIPVGGLLALAGGILARLLGW